MESENEDATTAPKSEISALQRELYKVTLRHIIDFARCYCENGKAGTPITVTDSCLDALKDTAKAPSCRYPWNILKVVLAARVEELFDEFKEKGGNTGHLLPDEPAYELLQNFIVQQLLGFPLPPVTIQRICEVLINPGYKRLRQLSECLRKLVSVRGLIYGPVSVPHGIDLTLFPEIAEVEEKIFKLDTCGDDADDWMDDIDWETVRSLNVPDSRPHEADQSDEEQNKKRKISQDECDSVNGKLSDPDDIVCSRLLKRRNFLSAMKEDTAYEIGILNEYVDGHEL